MIQIVLNDEQAAILSRACHPVSVVDRSGKDLGQLVPAQFNATEPCKNLDSDVAEALQRMEDAKNGKGVFYTTTEVLDHLRSLEQS